MSDARWAEVAMDIDSAADHFTRAVIIADTRQPAEEGFDAYKTQMAFMHAMQSAHSSFEKAMVRILDLLEEARPSGDGWHADLIRRLGHAMSDRPAFLPAPLMPAANEARKFRHRVMHAYEDFDWDLAARAIAAARQLAAALPGLVEPFRAETDPD